MDGNNISEHHHMIVERKFTEIHLSHEHETLPPRTLDYFFNLNAFVVLGDPGAGKTTSFEQAAQNETDAIYATVRDLITLHIDRFRNRTLYIDALDEMRSLTEDGRTVLDKLRSRLDELGCPRFRISCRAADWYGGSDTKSLSEVSPDRTLAILRIEALDEDGISQIVSEIGIESKGFIDESRSRGI